MQQLNERQQKILDFIVKKGSVSNLEIVTYLKGTISRFTTLRDLEFLSEEGLIKKEGKGRGIHYIPVLASKINQFFDPEIYFKKGPDERDITTFFNSEVMDCLPDILSEEEIKNLEMMNSNYSRRIERIDQVFFKKEIERLTIELSWKSSQMEGNTYSLIDTEILIKDRVEAEGHKKEEAIMILNHKNVIDYIFGNKGEFKRIDLFHIEKIHELLVRGMGVRSGIRTGKVRIIGTRYSPMEGKLEITKKMHDAIEKINALSSPFSKALALILMISYIQPFEDGNKRTGRILGNAILLANNICPLSYRSVNESDYKKGIILFYEQNSAIFFKKMFIEQFKFSVDNYF
ncbi:MAG: Fic family protein [Candidatus Pacebacteria bacterium]|nr:Fic family protein [Candidatus Paceibacterota bacterium]